MTRTDWVPGGGWPKSFSKRRRRAPVEAGLVVVVVVDEVDEAGSGNRILIWPLVESNVFVPMMFGGFAPS